MNHARTMTRSAAALFAAAALLPAQASPLVAFEGFETVPTRDTSLSSLNTLVGLFTPAAGGSGNVYVSSPGYTNFGPGLNPTTSSILTANGDESFNWALAFAAATVSLEIYLNDLGPATMSFFDAADTLLASFTYAADADNSNNLVSLSYNAGSDVITRATFISTRGGVLNTGLDNITIGQAGTTVPEPAGLLLVLTAAGIAVEAGRRAGAAARGGRGAAG
jgi:hypothetical protein